MKIKSNLLRRPRGTFDFANKSLRARRVPLIRVFRAKRYLQVQCISLSSDLDGIVIYIINVTKKITPHTVRLIVFSLLSLSRLFVECSFLYYMCFMLLPSLIFFSCRYFDFYLLFFIIISLLLFLFFVVEYHSSNKSACAAAAAERKKIRVKCRLYFFYRCVCCLLLLLLLWLIIAIVVSRTLMLWMGCSANSRHPRIWRIVG